MILRLLQDMPFVHAMLCHVPCWLATLWFQAAPKLMLYKQMAIALVRPESYCGVGTWQDDVRVEGHAVEEVDGDRSHASFNVLNQFKLAHLF